MTNDLSSITLTSKLNQTEESLSERICNLTGLAGL
jgi:hypothetical protein